MNTKKIRRKCALGFLATIFAICLGATFNLVCGQAISGGAQSAQSESTAAAANSSSAQSSEEVMSDYGQFAQDSVSVQANATSTAEMLKTDGTYSVNVELRKTDKTSLSMAAGIVEGCKIVVKKGVCTTYLDLQPLVVFGVTGNVGGLSYYADGFTYDASGNPQGTLVESTVVSTYVGTDGTSYPDIVSFPLVGNGASEFQPLQFTVPAMGMTPEAILYYDWSSLTDLIATGKADLQSVIDVADAITVGSKTQAAFVTLQNAIRTAEGIVARTYPTVDQLTSGKTALEEAIATFNASADRTTLNPVGLADGKYQINIELRKTTQTDVSMANGAFSPTMDIEVKNGVYTGSITLKPLTMMGITSSLSDFKYYEAGYTLTRQGILKGTSAASTIVSTLKNADGTDYIDEYNDANNLYPEVVKFPLVDNGASMYQPIQMFIPVMETLAEGFGTQISLLYLDWDSLVKTGELDKTTTINVSPITGNGTININGQALTGNSSNTVEVKSDETLTISWSGGQGATTSNISLLSSLSLNGSAIDVNSSINKTTWQVENSAFMKAMNQSGVKMTTLDSIKNAQQTITINASTLASLTSSTLTNATQNTLDVTFTEYVPVYRLYNMVTSEHLFTTNKTEYDNFVAKLAAGQDVWIGEGIDWLAPATGSVVYRLYNAALGAMQHSSHYYTTDKTEADTLVANSGWKYDDAVNYFQSGGSTAIYTCYNEALGSAHHYTSSRTEWEGLAANGWNLEEAKSVKNNVHVGFFQAEMSAKP